MFSVVPCFNTIVDSFEHLDNDVGLVVPCYNEEPTISSKRDDIIENEMVFTIEPGIYIENQFGVRIEDTVLLREGKVETLSKATKEIIII